MLQTLRITNYALIESLEISFDSGFLSITGETGAGKSIMLGALSLIMGKRADTSILKDSSKKSVIEAEFIISKDDITQVFISHDIDFERLTLIRREILPQGKSRAFINDTPVQLPVLKEISELLLDIHSQHQNLFLKESFFQMKVVDTFAQNKQLLTQYTHLFQQWKAAHDSLVAFREHIQKAKQEYDYFLFRYTELEQAKLQEGEIETLEQEYALAEHGEDIKQLLSEAEHSFTNDTFSILAAIKKIAQNFDKHASVSHEIQDIAARLSQANIELTDISYEISRIHSNFSYDPQKTEEIQARLDLLNSLLRKFNCSSITDLITEKEVLHTAISSVETYEFEEKEREKKVQESWEELYNFGIELSKHRKKAAKEIEIYVVSLLQQLGMPSVRFEIQLETDKKPFCNGFDTIKMLFSANKNVPLQWLGEVASGGEISRIMLCLKSILAKSSEIETIIFDEIDTGVSGEIAHKMGDVMKDIAQHMQVISITHLPQIASKSLKQFKVFKTETSETTITNIIALSHEERIMEIAKMISGQHITQEAIANATVLLRQS